MVMSDDTTSPSEKTGCLLPLWAILLILGIVVACAILSVPVFNTLYGIVFPPTPPIPPDAIQTERQVVEHGVEENRYTITQNPCELVRFFISENGTCEVFWDFCEADTFPTYNRSFIPFASCQGISPAGVFAVRWKVEIDLLSPPDQTAFRMSHEVLWSGMPLPTSTPSQP
ncbi:MAG: hypothetical protein CUN52_01670 [Phototrophicales bacterium]|nr:MAG: hypothetical protein CUN52_01670 [Phototrophicales bacterium]